ncbi:MAG: 50S ribosomal protein L25/general stress protein Ctc [Pseudomonadota bacterium]
MSDTLELEATVRDRVGKGAARAVRREGLVPCIIYGNKKTPEPIAIERRIIAKQLNTGQFLSTVYNINVSGKKTRVIPRGFELDKVKDFPIHVDFLRIAADAVVTVEIPVQFINEDVSPGLKRGGMLNVVRHAVEVNCPADQIPDHFVADIGELDIGDVVHISAIALPENVEPTITDRDFTVATIASPGGGAEAADDGDAESAEEEAEAEE